MSDTWYRDPLPPYEDGFGRLWALDGTQAGGPLGEPAPEWLAAWPEDLQWEALRAAMAMDFIEGYMEELANLDSVGHWPKVRAIPQGA